MTRFEQLQALALSLPEAERVDIEAWGDSPTFRVRGKNFVFTNFAATSLTIKLPKDEAAMLVDGDARAEPTGYGLGRHGWVSLELGEAPLDDDGWAEVEDLVLTSYTVVAPKTLARQVLADHAEGGT